MTGGANDYQGDYNQFDATTSAGKALYGSVLIQPSGSDFGLVNSDPVAVYDRDGVAYNQEIAFQFDDANGVFVWRSTNGGFTWSRPCIPIENAATPDPDDAACGAVGDVRQPGDGVITWNRDPTPGNFNGDAPFDDKNRLAAGPRPDGVQPTCFTPITRTPKACDPKVIGSDRLQATWTRFDVDGTGKIMHSYSDDQARSWSPPKAISGTAAFCIGIVAANACDDNQRRRCRQSIQGRGCWASRSRTSTRPARTSTSSSAHRTAATRSRALSTSRRSSTSTTPAARRGLTA